MWYESKVLRGNKQGRTIGYPTINLDPSVLPPEIKEGVYAALVKHDGKIYKGALFFGPRVILKETKKVLEIHLIDFSKEIYDNIILFQILDCIREVQNFSSLNELKEQIKKDVVAVEVILNK